MTNIFFDLADLKSCGDHVIIGKTARIRYPELVEIGDNVIIDDFTYISTSLMIDSFVHISSGCKLIGGSSSCIKISSFSTLSPNVVLAACSDDYISGIATPLVDKKYKGNVSPGIIICNKPPYIKTLWMLNFQSTCYRNGVFIGSKYYSFLQTLASLSPFKIFINLFY